MRSLIAGLIVFIAAGTICVAAGQVGEAIPPIELKDVAGKDVTSSEWSGKVVVLSFFATWAKPATDQVKGLVDLHGKYKDAGLVVVGIAFDAAGPDFVAETMRNLGVQYQVCMGVEGETNEAFGVAKIPTTLVVGPDGLIKYRYDGFQTPETIEGDVKLLLGK